MLGDVNETGTALVVKSMRVLVECFPQQAPQFLEDMLVKLLGLLFSSEEPMSCKREYAILLCHVIVFNSPYFMHICRGLQATHQTTILPGFVQFLCEMVGTMRLMMLGDERDTDFHSSLGLDGTGNGQVE